MARSKTKRPAKPSPIQPQELSPEQCLAANLFVARQETSSLSHRVIELENENAALRQRCANLAEALHKLQSQNEARDNASLLSAHGIPDGWVLRKKGDGWTMEPPQAKA